MSIHGIDDKPPPLPTFGVLGAMIGAATENLLVGAGARVTDDLTAAIIGAILGMTVVVWLRSG